MPIQAVGILFSFLPPQLIHKDPLLRKFCLQCAGQKNVITLGHINQDNHVYEREMLYTCRHSVSASAEGGILAPTVFAPCNLVSMLPYMAKGIKVARWLALK